MFDSNSYDLTTPVLVLRLDPNIFHHGTLGIIRSLGRAGVPVHAVLESASAPAARSRYLRSMHKWRPEMLDPGELLSTLQTIASAIGRRAVLMLVDDRGAIFAAEHATALAECFLLPEQSPSLPRRVADKSRLPELCNELGMACPETRVPTSRSEVRDAVKHLGLPLVAKWSMPWLPTPTRTTVISCEEEVEALFAMSPMAGGRLILQRRLPPGPEVDWFYHGYFDSSSRCVWGAVGLKERAYPPEAGLTTFGRWAHNPLLARLAEEFARRLGYSGVLDLDFRLDMVSGRYCLLDFNPRFGAQFRLFTDSYGMDLARVTYLDVTGQGTPAISPRYGRTFMVETYDPVSAAIQLKNRSLRLRYWVRSMLHVNELAWLAWDDPLSSATMVPQWIRFCLRRLVRGAPTLLSPIGKDVSCR